MAELGVFVAAQAIGMLLADWGADVIKFEALGTFPSYHDPRVDRPVRTVGSPAQFTSLPRTISTGAPGLGQRTDEVLSGLGLGD